MPLLLSYRILALAVLAGPLPAAASAEPPKSSSASVETANAAFQKLKSLVGTWRNAERPQSALRIHFSLTAGGTVLVESWTRDGAPHSLTLYHRDGDRLIATHYCPQGNQPRLALVGKSPGLRFAFIDATDLDAKRESYLHDLAFDLTDPARPVRQEAYRTGSTNEKSTLVLQRAP